MPSGDPARLLDQIRSYLQESFPRVTIAHDGNGKTGSRLIHVLKGRKRVAIEITDTFLDADADLLPPLDALRKWNLIGTLNEAESGSIVRVTTTGVRLV
jgi:hypothetical protein